MDKAAPPPKSPPLPPLHETALHQDDATEEDENVKQLGDCSAVYLSLQQQRLEVLSKGYALNPLIFMST
ncbi:hypothetical protein COLO4_25738 [Corchorus olitorius]|uniref:Uncharacterized protein n=1 Tax=Corchorus olitorius TaxID=93759 RepID=A0A1R3I0C9_9ROSI|nr:hypothetical protein COLO4_25738 [Corchorus olitorius]